MINSHRALNMVMLQFVLGLASLFTFLIPIGQANEICLSPSEYRDCFERDLSWSLVEKRRPELSSQLERVQEAFTRSKDITQRARVAVATLSDIKKQLEENAGNFEKEALDKFVLGLSEAIDWYRSVGNGIQPNNNSPVFIDNFKLQGDGAGAAPKEWLRRKNCWSVTQKNRVNDCEDEFIKARKLGESIVYVGTVVDKYYVTPRGELLDKLKIREAEWNAYLYATQFQYPWELMLNRYKDNKSAERDDYGNEIGIREAPKKKRIFLHPDVGVQYVSGQVKGEHLIPTLTFQWCGIQKWDSYSENGIVGLRGVSLVTTVADHKNVSSIGHGLMAHYNSYSVALTSHSGKLAITLNLNLASGLSKINNDLANKLKAPK